MKTILQLGFVALLTFSVSAADPITETFQKGLYQEEVANNLESAIQAYSSVLAKLDEQRRLAATAAFRLGESYRRLGKTNEAANFYERVVRDFSDHQRLVELSRKALADLGRSIPAGLAAKIESTGVRAAPETGVPEEERREITRIQHILKNSPDLINSTVSGDSILHKAAAKGQLAVVRFLLDNGADIDVRAKNGHTPLHAASDGGHMAIARLLVERGAKVNARADDGETALHMAARLGFRSLTEFLLDRGAEISAIDREGETALHEAVVARHEPVVKLLLDRGGDPNAKDQSGSTPLHYAANRGRTEITQLLLGCKADVNSKNNGGETPLNAAVQKWDETNARLLLKHGADPNNPGQSFSDGPRTLTQQTPLHQAVHSQNRRWIDLLLEFKADVNAKDGAGATPLWMAVSKHDVEMVKLLLEKGADPNIPDGSGTAPLVNFTRQNLSLHAPVAELLMAHGAEVNVKRQDGATALHLAASAGAAKMVQQLLSKGADPNAKGPRGIRPLHVAWPAEIVEALIEKGADVNAQDDHGNTPLHYVAWRNIKAVAEVLLQHGAKPDLTNKANQTPLEFAKVRFNQFTEWGIPNVEGGIVDLPPAIARPPH